MKGGRIEYLFLKRKYVCPVCLFLHFYDLASEIFASDYEIYYKLGRFAISISVIASISSQNSSEYPPFTISLNYWEKECSPLSPSWSLSSSSINRVFIAIVIYGSLKAAKNSSILPNAYTSIFYGSSPEYDW